MISEQSATSSPGNGTIEEMNNAQGGCSPHTDPSTAILTIWSAQVAQMERILAAGKVTCDGAKMGVLMLSSLKDEILSQMRTSDDAWRIASVIDHDWDRVVVAHSYRGVL